MAKNSHESAYWLQSELAHLQAEEELENPSLLRGDSHDCLLSLLGSEQLKLQVQSGAGIEED